MLLLANEMVCVGVFVLFGGIGFLILVSSMVMRVLRGAWSALFGPDPERAQLMNQHVRCANPACGELNWSQVRYCKRCGNPLTTALSVDRYG